MSSDGNNDQKPSFQIEQTELAEQENAKDNADDHKKEIFIKNLEKTVGLLYDELKSLFIENTRLRASLESTPQETILNLSDLTQSSDMLKDIDDLISLISKR